MGSFTDHPADYRQILMKFSATVVLHKKTNGKTGVSPTEKPRFFN
jgi:hypothetical protein